MTVSVRELIWILQMFFPLEMAVPQALSVLGALISLYPVLALHTNQRLGPHQPAVTGWMKSIQSLLTRAFIEEADDLNAWTNGLNLAPEYSGYICKDIDRLYSLLGLQHYDGNLSTFLFRRPHPILSTPRLNCRFCPAGDSNLVPSLRRRLKNNTQKIWLLDASLQWVPATLLVGHCAKCKADYYPDCITRVGLRRGHRVQMLEYDAEFLRVSKHGIWVHRKIALSQEKALNRFHSGWSNFADWINDSTEDINVKFTYRQSQRLFLEHFARRLLVAHNRAEDFSCYAHSSAHILAGKVREVIGENGGIVPSAMSHGCMDCTHVKQFASVSNGAPDPAGGTEVVDSESGPAGEMEPGAAEAQPLPPNMPVVLPQQASPAEGAPRGYVRMAVMDGKTLKHRMTATTLFTTTKMGVSVKSTWIMPTYAGLFLAEGLCILVMPSPAMTKLILPGINNMKIDSIGCLSQVYRELFGDSLTVQWACGLPIGWGKCYRAESTPQVLSFLNKVWEDHPDSRPSFIGYDKACDLLRHIVTQNPNDLWIKSTKFIVDAWHYIGHRATDILCRTRCNPAPTNGSQPDLVVTEVDANGVVHQARAFNTETAEQLNSWLNGFESQLRQMTDMNFDFFIHVSMLIYGETVTKRVVSKGRELTPEFWKEVNGDSDMDVDV
ncbi:hypothetical protein C8J57DRAFT_1567340 [Mycena rebaudengoi]|nr:hypothetical protein C8J57DRAFT_1567340 [Mycena rebaudengoi]